MIGVLRPRNYWMRPPQGPVVFNRAHVQAQKVIAFFPLNEGNPNAAKDLVRGYTLTSGGTLVVGDGYEHGGTGISGTAASTDYAFASLAPMPATGWPVSMLSWVRPSDATHEIDACAMTNDTGGAGYASLVLDGSNAYGGTDNKVVMDRSGPSSNCARGTAQWNANEWTLGAGYVASSTSVGCYLLRGDGLNKVTNTNLVNAGTAWTRLHVAAIRTSTPTTFGPIAGTQMWATFFTGVLSDDEFWSFHEPNTRFALAYQLGRVTYSYRTSGGTGYTASLSGSSTATGSLRLQVNKALAGSETASAAISRAASKSLSGSETAAAALNKLAAKAFAGAEAGTAALTKQPQKSFSGSSTATATERNQAQKGLTGSSTGAAALTKAVAKAASANCTGAGALGNQTNKPLSGGATPAASVSSLAAKAFAGSAQPAASETHAVAKALAGSTTPAAALATAVAKSAAGSCVPGAAVANQAQKPLAGATTGTAAVSKQAAKSLSGGSTPSGSLSVVRAVLVALAGAVTAGGALVRSALKALVGYVTGSGELTTEGGTPDTLPNRAVFTMPVCRRATFAGPVCRRAVFTMPVCRRKEF